MKETNEIITYLEDQILIRAKQKKDLQAEMDSLDQCITLLRQNSEPQIISSLLTSIEESNVSNYPGYPLNESLLKKFGYLEQFSLSVWRLDEMKALIEKVEGSEQAKKTLAGINWRNNYMIKKCELIKIRYDNKNSYSFFTTRQEWLERQADGSVRLLPEHGPEPTVLARLTEMQKEKVTIMGLKN